MGIGSLKIQTFRDGLPKPVSNAKVKVTLFDEKDTVNNVVELTTDDSGIAVLDEVKAPPLELSLDKNADKRPYSLCNVLVQKDGYADTLVEGCQLYSDQEAIQKIDFKPLTRNVSVYRQDTIIIVLPNTLYGDYPPKIPEAEEKPLKEATGQVVLPEVVVPEFVTIHMGSPNVAAKQYTVTFKDYVKNVASSEIYPTWPSSALRANIYAIVSFTLNRVYTEWYRNKGKDFTITNSTAYDHAFSYGRNIFRNISSIVDEIFSTYMKRPGAKQPLLSQYCDGKMVKCPGWMTQWGSKDLADLGYTPYQILTNFYGTNLDLVRAKQVKGIPISYPGYALKVGSKGSPVRDVQKYLNRISQNYPAIPKVPVDGIYGKNTADSIKKFQEIFNVNVSGIVDYDTWYALSNIYVGVTEIGELREGFFGNDLREFRPYSPFSEIPKIHY